MGALLMISSHHNFKFYAYCESDLCSDVLNVVHNGHEWNLLFKYSETWMSEREIFSSVKIKV